MTRPAVHRMTIQQASESFNVSRTTLYEAVRAGDLPAIKPLSSWLVRPDDVEAWLVELDRVRLEESA